MVAFGKKEYTFFLKYFRYSKGIRFHVNRETHIFWLAHNEEPQSDDIHLDAGFESIEYLRVQLQNIDHEHGERWFIYFVQELIGFSEKIVRRERERKNRKSKKANK